MDIPIDKIKTNEGDRIIDSVAAAAYRMFVQGRREDARTMLIQAHFDFYYGPRLVIATDKIVQEVYRRRGRPKPENYQDVEHDIALEAVTRRVDDYLAALDETIRTGRLTRDEPLRVSMVDDEYILKSCGYNDIAAWAATEHETVPDVVLVPEKEITICACWDGRDYYDPEYVNILYRSVERNTTIPFDFVLFVGPEAMKPGRCDTIDKRIKIMPVGLPYWWSGMCAWEKVPPGVETESILYIDIDQVIVGSLDEIIRYPSNHALMKDYPAYCCPKGLEGDGNASVSLIRNGAGAKVWAEYVRLGKPQWNPLDPPPQRFLPLAAQGIVNDPAVGIPHDVFPEVWVSSYRLYVSKWGLPEDCRVVSFHGLPKPHDMVKKHDWVKEHWR
jgi:hypothetical protein